MLMCGHRGSGLGAGWSVSPLPSSEGCWEPPLQEQFGPPCSPELKSSILTWEGVCRAVPLCPSLPGLCPVSGVAEPGWFRKEKLLGLDPFVFCCVWDGRELPFQEPGERGRAPGPRWDVDDLGPFFISHPIDHSGQSTELLDDKGRLG